MTTFSVLDPQTNCRLLATIAVLSRFFVLFLFFYIDIYVFLYIFFFILCFFVFQVVADHRFYNDIAGKRDASAVKYLVGLVAEKVFYLSLLGIHGDKF